MSGYRPIKKVKKIKGKNTKNSLRVRSLKVTIEYCFTLPKIIRLQSHKL